MAAADAPAMPPAPVRHRHHQAGQQHIVDAAMEGRRQPGQQRAGDGGRQRERELAGRAADVARRIERAVDQRQRRRAQHAAPERKLVVEARRILGVRRQPLRPAPERGAAWRQRTAPRRSQSPARPRPGPAAGCARTRRRPQDDGWSAAAVRPPRQPASNHTACSITPAAGASRRAAACACSPMQARRATSSSPRTSIRRRQSPAATAPGGATSRLHCAPSAVPSSRSRNAS